MKLTKMTIKMVLFSFSFVLAGEFNSFTLNPPDEIFSADGKRLASLRAGDGLFTLAFAGGLRLHGAFSQPAFRHRSLGWMAANSAKFFGGLSLSKPRIWPPCSTTWGTRGNTSIFSATSWSMPDFNLTRRPLTLRASSTLLANASFIARSMVIVC